MKNIIVGRTNMARKLNVTTNLIKWLEEKGKIKPKREKITGMNLLAYGKKEQEEIYKWKTRAD